MRVAIPSSCNAPPDFNALAPLYRWMEWLSFGPMLQCCRCAFLDSLATERRALIYGDGDGRFTAALLQKNELIEIDAVDASAAMLAELQRRAGNDRRRVKTHCADARSWQPESPPYDLVVTHFFLDCLTQEEAESLTKTVRNVCAPSPRWIVSEFAVPAGWYGALVARPIVRGLYCAFGMLTGLKVHALCDYRAALRQSGFSLLRQRRWLGGLLISELWSI